MMVVQTAKPLLRARGCLLGVVAPALLLLAGCSGKQSGTTEQKKDGAAEGKPGATDKKPSAIEKKPAAFEEEKLDAAEMAARQQSKDNLRQLALGMHNYNDSRRGLPAAASKGKDGKPLLSWRVELLQVLGQPEAKLYQEFKLDEPWDSEHNKKLLARMPKIYAPPVPGKTNDPNATFYQVFVGDGVFGRAQARIPGSFVDGTSNTMLIVESGEEVPWTKPADLEYRAKQSVSKLGGLFEAGFHAAMGDGSVYFFKRKKLTEATLRAAITPDAGDTLGPDFVTARRETAPSHPAIGEIEELGGEVYPDKPNEPVVMIMFGRLTTDKDVALVKPFAETLTNVQLGGTQITDKGLEHLQGLTKIKILTLSGTKITDQGLQHLKGLTTLESLGLEGTQVTAGGIKELKQSLPRARVRGSTGSPKIKN